MGQADGIRPVHAGSSSEPAEPPVPPGPGEVGDKNWELAWIDLGGEG